jgi:hypothetical protein
LRLVPVLRDDTPAAEAEVIADFASRHGPELALRLSSALWANIGTPIGNAALADVIERSRLGAENLHLFLDLEVVDSPAVMAAAVRGALAQLGDLGAWRTITALGTSMPATTAIVGRDSTAQLPRSEWALWKSLRGASTRQITFGDYAIQSIDSLSTFNPKTMQSAAQFRYTTANDWLIARGRGTRTGGFTQAHRLAAMVVNHEDFSGRDFSAGDEWIANCAAGATGPGNPTSWRQAGTSHHLTFVVSQLATLRGV